MTDTVSDGFQLENTCGNLTYKVTGPESEFVSVAHEPGAETYDISIDTSKYEKVGEHIVIIEVGLIDYHEI